MTPTHTLHDFSLRLISRTFTIIASLLLQNWTHQHGRHLVDLMIGSLLFAMALIHACILPFGVPALIKGDHCLLGLDFDPDTLFGNPPSDPAAPNTQGVNSQHA